MKKRSSPPDRSDHSADESSLRVPGAARRRLLRALGRSGGITVGALLSAPWHKPLVKSVVLPAHGQTSPSEPGSEPGPVGCPITVDLSFFDRGPGGGIYTDPYSLSLFVNDTIVNSTATSGVESTSLSGASTFPPGTYSAGLSVDFNDDTDFNAFSFTLDLACCDATEQLAGSQVGDFATAAEFVVSDDGECAVND